MAKITVWGDFKVNAVERLRISDSLRQLLGESNANVVNCEAPIRGVGSPVRKSGPNISQSSESPGWLEEHGFNVVSLANMLQFGELLLRASGEEVGACELV